MALTGGASHAASGTGSVAISSPAALRVSFTTIPAFLGADTGTPVEYFGLGRINVGTSLGYMDHVDIVCSPQLLLGLPAGLTVVAWDFAPGVVASIQELVETATVNLSQPWDRSPVQVGSDASTQAGEPSAETVMWSYTVPAGRRLWLASARVAITRVTASTVGCYDACWISTTSSRIAIVVNMDQAVGVRKQDDVNGAALILTAGQSISASRYSGAGNGQVWFNASFSGTLFDA